LASAAPPLSGQDLVPRAYTITPLRSNAVIAGYNYNHGDLLFEGTVPITDAIGRLSMPSLSYYRAFGLFGRSANVLAGMAYGVGTFEGEVRGEPRSIYRSGLFDSVFGCRVDRDLHRMREDEPRRRENRKTRLRMFYDAPRLT
jgi:hypothetical protein